MQPSQSRGEHRVAERLGTVGVRALADEHHARRLVHRHRAVDRADARLELGRAARRLQAADRLDHLAEVLGRRAAAAADDADAELGDVAAVELGQLRRGQVVVRLAVDDRRQAGVGQHADRQRGVLAEVAQVLLHLRRTGGAVDPEHVGAHRLHARQDRADLAADEHPSGRLHRHLHLQRHLAPGGAHRPPARLHRRLHLQQVDARLDEEQVDAALREPGGLLLVGVAQVVERDVPEARQLGARPDRAGDVARPAVGGVVVGDLARQAGTGDVQLVRLLRDGVLVEHHAEAAEARRLQHVDADVQERVVHRADDVGPGEAEHLVAALEARAAEVVGGEVESLDERAEGTVEHDDALPDGLEVGLAGHPDQAIHQFAGPA